MKQFLLDVLQSCFHNGTLHKYLATHYTVVNLTACIATRRRHRVPLVYILYLPSSQGPHQWLAVEKGGKKRLREEAQGVGGERGRSLRSVILAFQMHFIENGFWRVTQLRCNYVYSTNFFQSLCPCRQPS
jgi:hypothetical protein